MAPGLTCRTLLSAGALSILVFSAFARAERSPDDPASGTNAVVAGVAAALESIEKQFADVKTVQAAFVQTKQLAIFNRAITLEGRVALENPGRLAWRVDRPVRYTVVLDGTVIRQWDEDSGNVQKLSLAGNPVFQAVAQQLQVWFSGKYASLAGEYDIRLGESAAQTVLVFTPRSSSAARQAIRRVTVSFREDRRYIEAILIEDVSGDRTRVQFTGTKLNEPIDPREWKVEPD